MQMMLMNSNNLGSSSDCERTELLIALGLLFGVQLGVRGEEDEVEDVQVAGIKRQG